MPGPTSEPPPAAPEPGPPGPPQSAGADRRRSGSPAAAPRAGRGATVAVLALLVFAPLGAAVTPAAAATTHVAIRSVTVSPDQPAPGESFTLRATVANLAASSGPVEVTDVYVRRPGTARDYARIEDVGSIPAGETLTIPLRMRIADPGEHRLTVHLVVQDGAGNYTRIQYPLYVTVEEPDEALVSVASLDPIAGQNHAVDVTVTNGDDAPLSNVRLEVSGAATVETPERVSASIQAGTQATYTFRVTFPEAGRQRLAAAVAYTTSEGVRRSFTREVGVEVDRAVVDPELEASVAKHNGSTTIETDLRQYGNVALEDVRVRAVVDGETLARTSLPDVPAEGRVAAALDASVLPAGDVTVVAEFLAAGTRRAVNQTLRFTSDVDFEVERRVGEDGSVIAADLRQGGDVELRDVSVRLSLDGRPIDRALLPKVPGGTARTATFDGADIPAGDLALVAAYTAGGADRTVRETLRWTSDVDLAVERRVRAGESVLAATLHQYGDVDLRDVRIRVLAEGRRVARAALPDVLAERSQTATFNGSDLPGGPLSVVAAYTAGGERRTTGVDLRYAPAPPAAITLTGIEVTRRGSLLTLSGDAANVGTTEARSVIVSVRPTAGVTPVNPKKDYFVGAVDASEFATFELTANASAAVDELPVRIRYTVDGEQVTEAVVLDVGAASTRSDAGGDGGLPTASLVVALVVVLSVAGVLYHWRTR